MDATKPVDWDSKWTQTETLTIKGTTYVITGQVEGTDQLLGYWQGVDPSEPTTDATPDQPVTDPTEGPTEPVGPTEPTDPTDPTEPSGDPTPVTQFTSVGLIGKIDGKGDFGDG